jgi:hypothetical protein
VSKFWKVAALAGYMAATALPALAQTATIKTRLDHLSGTQWVLVISYLPSEITSITCDSWTMLGVTSWHHQNDFTIPAGLAVAIMDASKFDGYCAKPGSIVAHTDDGDFAGVLDRGAGNWDASTKLTFLAK